jgi:hypothetical protein
MYSENQDDVELLSRARGCTSIRLQVMLRSLLEDRIDEMRLDANVPYNPKVSKCEVVARLPRLATATSESSDEFALWTGFL